MLNDTRWNSPTVHLAERQYLFTLQASKPLVLQVMTGNALSISDTSYFLDGPSSPK